MTTERTFARTVVRDNPERGRYELFVGDELAGYLAYRMSHDRVLISSTVVRPEHRGHGLAGELVESALDDLRRQGRPVTTTCWYVKDWLDAHPACPTAASV